MISGSIRLELAQIVAFLVDLIQAFAQSSIIQLLNLKTEVRSHYFRMVEIRLFDIKSRHEQGNVLRKSVTFRLSNFFFLCYRSVIRVIVFAFG